MDSISAIPAAAPRVASVDALRGFNIFWLLGGEGLMLAIEDMSAGNTGLVATVGHLLGDQFRHAPWEGFRFWDFVFPLLIFVTGVSLVFSLTRIVQRDGKVGAHVRVLRRSLLLFVLGLMFYGGASRLWPDIRLLGVLQRIAVCYLLASLIFLNLPLRGMIAATVVLLVGYWALMTFVPVPGIGAGSFAPDANLANWVDARYLPGRMWDVTRDPEGLLSTLPAVATCLLGVFAGLLLQDAGLSARQKSFRLIGAGIVMVAAGHLWALQFPIIKAIWTSSFVLVAGGYSALLLGVLHQIIDVWGVRAWSAIFVWVGANALALYFINNLASFERFATRMVGGDIGNYLDRAVTPGTGRFAAHALGLVIAVVLARYLVRRKIYICV